tara:strand:+ start:1112 stop:1588 length:477 start_codon:yes stop_codon:yes gene_type:complete
MNIKEEDLQHIHHEVKLDNDQSKAILTKIKEHELANKKDKETRPKNVIRGIILGGDGYPDHASVDADEQQILPIKMQEDEDINLIRDRLQAAARKHNEGQKTKKDPCFTITDLLRKATKKNLREEGINFQNDHGIIHLIVLDNDLALGDDAESFTLSA